MRNFYDGKTITLNASFQITTKNKFVIEIKIQL